MTCSPFRHTSASSKAKVMERKQDALRGVESPLIFMAYERGPHKGSVGLYPSRRQALHNCSACSRRKCCRRVNSAGSRRSTPSDQQKLHDFPRLFRNGDRYSKQSARLKPEGSPKNNSTNIAVLFLETDYCNTFQDNQFIIFFNNLAALSSETAEKF